MLFLASLNIILLPSVPGLVIPTVNFFIRYLMLIYDLFINYDIFKCVKITNKNNAHDTPTIEIYLHEKIDFFLTSVC